MRIIASNFERYYNAKKAADLGCGYCLLNEEFNEVKLVKITKETMDKKPFHASLIKYSKEIKELGGARKAAKIILEKI